MTNYIHLKTTLLCACFFCVTGISYAQPGYTEDFTTTTYWDQLTTTADWNIAESQLKLHTFTPTLTGNASTTGDSREVCIVGDRAYVADGARGLVALSITDPTAPAPTWIYNTTGFAGGVDISGNYAYVADGVSGLQVLDLSDLLRATLAGTYNTSGFAGSVKVAGDHAYVADGSVTTVVDISDPTTPTLAASFNSLGFTRRLAIAGDRLYLAAGTAGLQVVDITDPTEPTLVGSVATSGEAYDVCVAGDRAYVAVSTSGLQVIDISNPAAPIVVGIYDTLGEARGVYVSGDNVYVADLASGLQVIEISDPAVPVLVGSYDTVGESHGVFVSGNQAYVTDSTAGVQVIEISRPMAPVQVGAHVTSNAALHVAIAGDYAYVADGISGLQVFDVSDPSLPVLVGSLDTGNGYVQGIAIAGDHAFVASGSEGLSVINISDPSAPVPVGSVVTPGSARKVVVSGDHAYVADGASGLQIVNISDPAVPILVGSYNVVTDVNAVQVRGDYAYVVAENIGLKIIDISNPSVPALMATYLTPGAAVNVRVAGFRAFVADGDSGLHVIDISDPSLPTLAGSNPDLDYVRDVALSGDQAYVVTANGIMHMVDISDPAQPMLVESLTNISTAMTASIAGDHAYVANFASGLRVIQVRQREVVQEDNRGQSADISGSNLTAIRARLTATSIGDVNHELSADFGNNWQIFPADNSWIPLTNPGSNLLWRSTLDWAPGSNPVMSQLSIEWLHDSAWIEAVSDIAADQGRQVRVQWSRSGHDFSGDGEQTVQYAIYRKIEAAMVGKTQPGSAPDLRSYSEAVQEHARLQQAAGWDFLTTIPVRLEDSYAVVVPTLADSTINGGQKFSTFMVSALTSTPGVFFDSPPDSGYSVDNLAPGVPMGILASYQPGSVVLDWDDAPEADFRFYRVYRGTDPGFTPEAANLVQETAVSTWTDMSGDPALHHYRISAVDRAGNEGEAGGIGAASAVPEAGAGLTFVLRDAVPNPFNPSTAISYSIATADRVQVVVYSVAGRAVRTLVDEVQRAGAYTVLWDGLDRSGERVASGVYLYELRAGLLSERKRMLLLK